MVLEAHAKINWTLEVLGARSDGYHDLRSIVLPISMHDTVTIEEARDISCRMDLGNVRRESNLAYRAAVALRDATGCRRGASIGIEKRIPMGAGLGGGSADAAAVLNGLNALWGLNLSKTDLCEIAAGVGSDVPALTLGGAVLMEGRGERVSPLDLGCLCMGGGVTDDGEGAVATTASHCERHRNDIESALGGLPRMEDIVVFVPRIFASTPAVYHEFRESDRGLCHNDLQPAAIRLYSGIADAIHTLEARGLQRVTMSGSGSAVYGVRQ